MSQFSPESRDEQPGLSGVVGCIPIVLGCFFFVMGSAMLVFGIRTLILAEASRSWPTVRGKISVSEMGVHSDEKNTTYSADVVYDYTVHGTQYTGSRVAFGLISTSSTSRARRILNRYPRGKEVVVYYDSSDPEESVLEPGIHGATWFLPGIGLLFTVVGAAVFLFRKQFVSRRNILHVARGMPRIASVEVTDDSFFVSLNNGQAIHVPFSLCPRLESAHPNEREYWELRNFGSKISWPKLDFEITLVELLRGDFSTD